MQGVSISRTVVGHSSSRARRFALVAVGLGMLGYLAGEFVATLQAFQLFPVVVVAFVGIGLWLSAVHAFRNGGLLVSWLLVFCPTAGPMAYGAARTPPGSRALGLDALLTGSAYGFIVALIGGTIVFLAVVTGRSILHGRPTTSRTTSNPLP